MSTLAHQLISRSSHHIMQSNPEPHLRVNLYLVSIRVNPVEAVVMRMGIGLVMLTFRFHHLAESVEGFSSSTVLTL